MYLSCVSRAQKDKIKALTKRGKMFPYAIRGALFREAKYVPAVQQKHILITETMLLA